MLIICTKFNIFYNTKFSTTIQEIVIMSEKKSESKKYKRLAVQFSVQILVILAFFFTLQGVVTVSNVRKSSAKDYSDFCKKIIEEDAGKISNWNEILVNDLRLYSDADVTAGLNPMKK